MPEFLEQYGTKEQCEAALVKMRWPNGWVCPKCACTRYAAAHNGRKLWECLGCEYQCSSIAGTVFEHTKLALSIWFLGIYLYYLKFRGSFWQPKRVQTLELRGFQAQLQGVKLKGLRKEALHM